MRSSAVDSVYFGRVHLSAMLDKQEQVKKQINSGACGGLLMGFECEPVVSLGRRAKIEDFLWSEEKFRKQGFEIVQVDRGGQATLHLPGQLVIFPVVAVGDLGAKEWVCRIVRCTQEFSSRLGTPLDWDEGAPGLYHQGAKVASIGLRVSGGVSTHGIAINISNDLLPYEGIKVCGVNGARVARLGVDFGLQRLFSLWCETFIEQSQHRSRC